MKCCQLSRGNVAPRCRYMVDLNSDSLFKPYYLDVSYKRLIKYVVRWATRPELKYNLLTNKFYFISGLQIVPLSPHPFAIYLSSIMIPCTQHVLVISVAYCTG